MISDMDSKRSFVLGRFMGFFALFLCVLACIGLISGCSALKSDKKDKPSVPSAPRWTASFVGYACSWDWHTIKPKQLADVLDYVGANITLIEIDFKKPPQFVADWVKPFRDKKITVEIILVNANTKSARDRSTAEFKKYFNDLKIALKTTDYILMQAVTEPGNRGGDKNKLREWIKYANDNWPGKKVQSVRDGWWGNDFKVDYAEHHWCKDYPENVIKTGNHITTTDCTPLINLPPERVYSMTKKFLKKKAHFIYYHADWASTKPGGKPTQIDYGKLDAIKRAVEGK